MQVDGSQKSSNFSRNTGNEVSKGYYPTDPSDVADIVAALDPGFFWMRRGQSASINLLDPCAGEGGLLSAANRKLSLLAKDYQKRRDYFDCQISSFAIELDRSRYEKIRGTQQKVCGSFFDMSIEGSFALSLLNPPYNRHDGEMLTWLQRVTPLTTYSGLLVFILPDYELHRPDMEEYLQQNFKYIQIFKSANYKQYKQLVVFLSRGGQSNVKSSPYYCDSQFSNFRNKDYPTFAEWYQKFSRTYSFDFQTQRSPIHPLIVAKDLEPIYKECEELVGAAASNMLSRIYPQAYDTSVRPLMTLRRAHAVQLAAMNSAIEPVEINGTPYLAKYMVKEVAESFKDGDTETTVTKPSVEAFLLDQQGNVLRAKDLGLDYYEFNTELSSLLLTRLTQMYRPLHEIGSDPDFLAEELERIGLMAPQKEAVKAIIKGFGAGYRGLGIRANTGTGKSWMAKAIKILLKDVKKTIFVTEPHLVPQIATEFKNEDFQVHVIDSWEDMKRLSKERPDGLYLLSYTRQRMYPSYAPVLPHRKTMVTRKDGCRTLVSGAVCPDCWTSLEGMKVRKTDKEKCPACGSALYTHLPENKRVSPSSFRKWLQQMDNAATIEHVTTHNKQLPYVKELKRIKFDLGCFDELHNVSNLLSNQGSSFIRLAATCKKVLGLTATITNGTAKSLYNIMWGLHPAVMEKDGWSRVTATEFQVRYGAFKEVRKSEDNNRHRGSEKVTTYDAAGISPAVLLYILPIIANVDSNDFTDLPPVHHEVVRCEQHPLVDKTIQEIEKIISDAESELLPGDRLALAAVKNAAILRAPDTFCHMNDELKVNLKGRGTIVLGSVQKKIISGLTDKEANCVRLVEEALSRGEKVVIYTGSTQHSDMRPVIRDLVKRHTEASVVLLPDSVPAKKVVQWLDNVQEDVICVPFKRVGTGVNISQRPVIIWYDYTPLSRLAEQGDGRNRRVVTAMIHRELFGEVRTCRYYYLTSGEPQNLQLSYTLEKRMIAKLTEGETPEIDPSELGGHGEQSFSALLTKALQTGKFNYTDPSELLKKMTERENAKLAGQAPIAAEQKVRLPEKTMPIKIAPIGKESSALLEMEQLNLFGEWAEVA